MAEPPPQKLTGGRAFCHNTRQMTTFCVIDFHKRLLTLRSISVIFIYIHSRIVKILWSDFSLIIPSIVTQGDIYLRRYNSCKNHLAFYSGDII